VPIPFGSFLSHDEKITRHLPEVHKLDSCPIVLFIVAADDEDVKLRHVVHLGYHKPSFLFVLEHHLRLVNYQLRAERVDFKETDNFFRIAEL